MDLLGANANDQLWREWQGGLIFHRKSLVVDLARGIYMAAEQV